MRIALVVHGFPPLERTGVETFSAALARVWTQAGHSVEVFAPRRAPELPHLAERREQRDGFGITWIALDRAKASIAERETPEGVAHCFGGFLDREQPAICHFHHLFKLGHGLVVEASRRAIPCVLTAHDYFPVCHRNTLLRPDLLRCTSLAQPEACARCDLAESFLNTRPELGDYHSGVLPEQLDQTSRDTLHALLDGAVGLGEIEWKKRVDERARIDALRIEAISGMDRILVPTRFLAERLIEGGVPQAKLRHWPYAVDAQKLRAIATAPVGGGGIPRFGYIGSITKHKGVHILVEAFAKLPKGSAELTLSGDSTDAPYRERVREAARAAGASWRGPFDASELVERLSAIDVLVVPSVWFENQPFVIQEAFAAGRPVIASRLGALPESVRHEHDGLLFDPGDADALCAAMRRFIEEPDLIDRLRANIPEVPDLVQSAGAHIALFEELIAERQEPCEPMPAHLRPFAERYAALAALSSRELFEKVAAGLDKLRRDLGCAEWNAGDMLGAVASGASQGRLRDERNERLWLRRSLEARGGELAAANEQAEWLKQTLDDRTAALEHERKRVEDEVRARESLERESGWLHDLKTILEQRIASLETAAATLERDREGERVWLRDSVSKLEQERNWLRKTVDVLKEERDWLLRTLEGVRLEADWRRTEMLTALSERSGWIGWLLGHSDLGRRMQAWDMRSRNGGQEPS